MYEIAIVLLAGWALWKTCQGWFRKLKIRRLEREKAALCKSLGNITMDFNNANDALSRYVNYYGPTAFPEKPMPMGRLNRNTPIDMNWPEEFD